MNDPFDEEWQIACTLLWKDVTLPQSVTVDDLDGTIFSKMRPDWLKVARVVYDTVTAFENRSIVIVANRSIAMDIIGARIRALAEDGRIESQGDLSRWRFSEVRLKPSS